MNAKGRGSKAARIGALLDYIRAPEREGSDEKCAYYAGQGFVTDSPGGHRAEMIALAQDAPRSADPVNHYILSWREGEVPLPEQIEQAMGLFLDELGMQGHQAVYGLHSDTDNLHLHIAVNRVHPETQRVVKINGGFDLEALHRAVARIEHAQGWMPEIRARYAVDEQGQVVRSARDAGEQRQPSQPKRDREAHCGEPSAERIAIEHAGPAIARARSWQELHAALGALGMRYERAGSGAKVFVGAVPVKASSIARAASLGNLEKRLGVYWQAPAGAHVSATLPSGLRPAPEAFESYQEARSRFHAERRDAWRELRSRICADRRALRGQHADRRRRILSHDFRGRGTLLLGLRAALAHEQRQDQAALHESQQRERHELRTRYGTFPSFEAWLRNQGRDQLAEEWRYRDTGRPQPRPQRLEPDAPSPAIGARFAAAWDARERERAQAFSALRAKQARDVAHMKVEATQRWRLVGLVSHGRLAGALWALHARRVNERAWRQLHERHRAAVRSVQLALPALQWSEWVRSQSVLDQADPHFRRSELLTTKPIDQRLPQNRASDLDAHVPTVGAGQRRGRSR